MAIRDHPASIPQESLETIHQKIRALVAQENVLRRARNAAVHNAVSQGISITNLARAIGVSRELLYRILRNTPPRQGGADGTVDAKTIALIEAQVVLLEASSKRLEAQRTRALTIRELLGSSEFTKAEIAQLAGVSTETIRKLRPAK